MKGQGRDIQKSKASPARAVATVDPAKEEIWESGKKLLEAEGKTREAAGKFIGMLCKEYGQILVLAAVRDCAKATPVVASEWLVARCQERRAKSANRQESLEQRNLEVARSWTEQKGANGPD